MDICSLAAMRRTIFHSQEILIRKDPVEFGMLIQWVCHNFLTASRLHRMDFPVHAVLNLFGMIPSHRKLSPAAILLRKSQLKAIGGPQARQEP